MVTAVRGEHSLADEQPSTLGNARMSREPIFVAGAAVAFAAGAAVAKRDTATGAGAMFTIYWSMLLLVVGFLMGRFAGRATAPEVEDAGLATEAAGGQPTLAPAAQPTAAQPTTAQQQAGGHDASGQPAAQPAAAEEEAQAPPPPPPPDQMQPAVDFVFVTTYGDRWHTVRHCIGLRSARSVQRVSSDLRAARIGCRYCVVQRAV